MWEKLKNTMTGEMIQQFRALAALTEDGGSVARPTCWLTTVRDPSSRGSNNILFWPTWVSRMHMVHIHTSLKCIFFFVCVCICVYVREGERDRETHRCREYEILVLY